MTLDLRGLTVAHRKAFFREDLRLTTFENVRLIRGN